VTPRNGSEVVEGLSNILLRDTTVSRLKGYRTLNTRTFSEAQLCDSIWQDNISATTVQQIFQDMQDSIDTTHAFIEALEQGGDC
jgi:hypothetical protein